MSDVISGKTAFFIGSPFQGLCALEAMHKFGIIDYDFYIYDTLSGSEMLIRLLQEKGISYKSILRKRYLVEYLLLAFEKHPYYKNFFIGNMFDDVSYAICSMYATQSPRLFYLDDGIQALAYLGEGSSYHPFKKKKWARIFDWVFRQKGLNEKKLFTIYDVKSQEVQAFHNDLSMFKTGTTCSPKNVFIIGTNSSILEYKNRSYSDYLVSLIHYIKKLYPEEFIYYCPHRRDANNREINYICEQNGVSFYNTEISVEYDFIKRGENPVAVVGFASNALFVLRALYPSVNICTVHYELSNANSDSIAKVLETRLNDNGISSIILF